MKHARKAALALIFFSLFAFPGFSSFYASGTFIVRVKQVHGAPVSDKYGRPSIKLTFRVLQHISGQGHVMNLYKDRVGKTYTAYLLIEKGAPRLAPGGKVRVKFEHVSGMYHNSKTGKNVRYLRNSWILMGRK